MFSGVLLITFPANFLWQGLNGVRRYNEIGYEYILRSRVVGNMKSKLIKRPLDYVAEFMGMYTLSLCEFLFITQRKFRRESCLSLKVHNDDTKIARKFIRTKFCNAVYDSGS